MNESDLSTAITVLIENICENYEILKRKFKDAVLRSKLIENIINIYAQKGMRLTDNQIDLYKDFADVRQEANERFERLIKRQDLFASGYLLKDNSKLEVMYEKVTRVKENQDELLSLCNELIEKSNTMLEAM